MFSAIRFLLVYILVIQATAFAGPLIDSVDPNRMGSFMTVRAYLVHVLKQFGTNESEVANLSLERLAHLVKRKVSLKLHSDVQSDPQASQVHMRINHVVNLVENGIKRGLLFKDIATVDKAISGVTISKFINFSVLSTMDAHMAKTNDDISYLLLGRNISDVSQSSTQSTSKPPPQTTQESRTPNRNILDELASMFDEQPKQTTNTTSRNPYENSVRTQASKEVKGYKLYQINEQSTHLTFDIYVTENATVEEANKLIHSQDFARAVKPIAEKHLQSMFSNTPIILQVRKEVQLIGPTKFEIKQLSAPPSTCGSMFNGLI